MRVVREGKATKRLVREEHGRENGRSWKERRDERKGEEREREMSENAGTDYARICIRRLMFACFKRGKESVFHYLTLMRKIDRCRGK